LIVLQQQGNRPLYDLNATENYQGMVSINFPAMPETIELVRTTDYQVVTNPAFPDGIHQYKGTSPLKIPVKFELHAFDKEYCPRGVLSLLQVASELHALTLPFGPETALVQAGEAATTVDGSEKGQIHNADPNSPAGRLEGTGYNIYPPATCYLELIITDRTSPGIACIGYVSEVNVTLHGPWLRGPGVARNLPTRGDFSFTFVHHPGHGNTWNFGQKDYTDQMEASAYANTVKERLFNTHHLLTHTNYHGFNDPL